MSKKVKILYHYHYYNPKVEAVSQEIKSLKGYFGGRIFISDKKRRIPNWLKLNLRENFIDLHHIYHPTLNLRPFLSDYVFKLKKPVVLSVITKPFRENELEIVRKKVSQLNTLAAIVVNDSESVRLLNSLGLKNVFQAVAGIDLSKFTPSPLPPLKRKLRLVMASSPHSLSGFKLKGVPLLLEALSKIEEVVVYFLWRGMFREEFQKLIARYDVETKVKIVDEIVEVNQFLEDKHGVIAPYPTLETNKAYPHSLLDGLAKNRAVLVSNVLPIAEVVEQNQAGVVFRPNVSQLIQAIGQFRQKITSFGNQPRLTAEKFFSVEQTIKDYQSIYQKVLSARK